MEKDTFIAILIDVSSYEIKEVEVRKTKSGEADIRHMWELIDCQTFDAVGIGKGDALFIDDNGLYSDKSTFNFLGNLYVGNGLIMGSDSEGESQDVFHTVSEIEDMVWSM